MVNQSKENWCGRIDLPTTFDNLRYHQVVACYEEVSELAFVPTIGLIGFSCDEGVKRYQGRIGAAEAPAAIRRALSNIPWRAPQPSKLKDYGDISYEESLETSQKKLGEKVYHILQHKECAIILGGGHETLYGHYLGVRKMYGVDVKIGILSIASRFSLHSYDQHTTSMSVMKQILDEDDHVTCFACGIGRYTNTNELFQRAEAYGVAYLCEDELARGELQTMMDEFTQTCDVMMISLCMDVLDVAYAPGVSIPAVCGLEPKQVREILQVATRQPNVISFNVCEVNPIHDQDHRTEKLAAHLTNIVMMGLLQAF